MYVPSHFVLNDKVEISKIVNDFPLATLVVNGKSGLIANHIPLFPIFEGEDIIGFEGHISKANPLISEIENGGEILSIFRAEDSYISPNWYPSKHDNHQQVPTWNYQAVHFNGKLEFIDDSKFLLRVLGKLTKTHENKIGEIEPWKMSQAPKEYIEKLLGEIIGIKIIVTKITAKNKLGQNKSKNDFDSVKNNLKTKNKTKIVQAMSNLK